MNFYIIVMIRFVSLACCHIPNWVSFFEWFDALWIFAVIALIHIINKKSHVIFHLHAFCHQTLSTVHCEIDISGRQIKLMERMQSMNQNCTNDWIFWAFDIITWTIFNICTKCVSDVDTDDSSDIQWGNVRKLSFISVSRRNPKFA